MNYNAGDFDIAVVGNVIQKIEKGFFRNPDGHTVVRIGLDIFGVGFRDLSQYDHGAICIHIPLGFRLNGIQTSGEPGLLGQFGERAQLQSVRQVFLTGVQSNLFHIRMLIIDTGEKHIIGVGKLLVFLINTVVFSGALCFLGSRPA